MSRKNSPPDGSSLVSKKFMFGQNVSQKPFKMWRTPQDQNTVSKLLEEYEWTSVLSIQSIQEKVQNFQSALMQMYNDCFPRPC